MLAGSVKVASSRVMFPDKLSYVLSISLRAGLNELGVNEKAFDCSLRSERRPFDTRLRLLAKSVKVALDRVLFLDDSSSVLLVSLRADPTEPGVNE